MFFSKKLRRRPYGIDLECLEEAMRTFAIATPRLSLLKAYMEYYCIELEPLPGEETKAISENSEAAEDAASGTRKLLTGPDLPAIEAKEPAGKTKISDKQDS